MHPILTRFELRDHYRVSLRTVDRWLENPAFPRIKAGRVVRFDLDVVQEYLNAKTRPAVLPMNPFRKRRKLKLA